MRNLKNAGLSVINFTTTERSITATCWDSSNNSLICAFGPSETDVLIELKRIRNGDHSEKDTKSIASWDAPCPNPNLTHDRIVNLQYFADTSTVCLILEGGDLVLVRESPLPGEELLEIVGSVDAGISAAQWSPDEELLAIFTKADTFVLMSRDFEPICDTATIAEDAALSKHVNVGWGKRETQFQGKRAKALRDPTMPEKVDEGFRSKYESYGAQISWRGDGQYVALNSAHSATRRMIRVYSRDGTLDSVSEPVDYLEDALSWRPAGNIIASVQRRETSVDTVFFERNGLRHGEFSLRIPPDALDSWGSVVNLSWNVDSTILASAFRDRVRLWTMGNYHYYLKQEIIFEKPNPSFLKIRWHPENPVRLAIHSHHEVRITDYTFAFSRASTYPPNDYGSVAVVDGDALKVTPLRTTNIPPPMALHEIKLAQCASQVAFSPSGNLLAALSHTLLQLFYYEQDSRTTKPHLMLTIDIAKEAPLLITTGIAFVNDNSFVMVGYDVAEKQQRSLEVVLKVNMDKQEAINGDGKAVSIISSGAKSTTNDVHLSGSVASTRLIDSTSPTKLPVICPLNDAIQVNEELIEFGLAPNGTLYADSRALLSNCTSFVLTPAHLIFTTTQHLLKFVHLTSANDLEIPPDQPEIDERCRSIERGARIVTVMPSTYALVLQMPRGNLETIYPRALVLAGIRAAIASKDYKRAFVACRNQRVDMNILHDHDPSQFMDSIHLFVEQVKRVDFIDLFLSQLRDEDVSLTMYKDTLRTPYVSMNNGVTEASASITSMSAPQESKVNRVCAAFLAVLKDRTATNLQNIVTAYVCKSPPDLEGGLGIVANLRKEGDELAERAAEHICFLADVNRLYDAALGMYDLDLVLQIAQQSQKDPREYLPYLQGLQEMPLLRTKFHIDHDLDRKDKALSHLYALGDFEEFKAYTDKHELYTDALELCKYNVPQLNEVMGLQAAFLLGRNRYKEAGIAFEYLGDHASALAAYRSISSHWREALFCALMIPLSPEETRSLAEDLAEALVEAKDYRSAAAIYLDHLEDLDTAARMFCRAALFADALRLVPLKLPSPATRKAFLREIIDPSLLEAFSTTTDLLADFKSQIHAQIPRLRELRIKKQQDPLAFYGGDPTHGDADTIPDNVSLAPTDATTSGGTFMTRYTGRTGTGTLASNATRKTSKNRRREERKRARGKKGSVYEEEYLVNSIGRLIERVNAVGEEVAGLIEALIRRGMRGQAAAVEEAMAEVVAACEGCVGEVFAEGDKSKAVVEGEEGYRPSGADAVFLEAVEGAGRMAKPIVKGFRRLGLLG